MITSMQIKRFFILLLPALLILAPYALADGLPDLGESSQLSLSPQMERRVGESIMRDIRFRDSAYLDDAEINTYINRLGSKLGAASPEAHQDFEFFVVRDPTLNAFAMPGGFIGIHSGLLLAAQTESELAGVLSHEISHVTQRHIARMLSKQGEAQMAALLSFAVAILAGRSNSDLASAAIMTGQAASIQSQLNYSRDYEREADRIGLQTLERGGFDVRGMGNFFERLQKNSRLYENNAPGYLRSHPLTTERISDMNNRIQLTPHQTVPDSVEFQLVRAKLRAQQNTPREAVVDFESQLRDKKYSSVAAGHYGLAVAKLRSKEYAAAEREVAELRAIKVVSPMIDNLAAEIKRAQGDLAGALRLYREGRARYAQNPALLYGQIETLLEDKQSQESLKTATSALVLYPTDAKLYSLQAKAYAALGKQLLQHRAQAEYYALSGLLAEAIQQLLLAQKTDDGNFYENSQIDARLRELRIQDTEEKKEKKPF